MEFSPQGEASGESGVSLERAGARYDAVVRLSEALSQCRNPEDLTNVLTQRLHGFLEFSLFPIIVYKEDSDEVESAVLGREKSLIAGYADVPVQQRPSWQAYATYELFHIQHWRTDGRVADRLKDGIAALGLDVGPLVFVPLTTPPRLTGFRMCFSLRSLRVGTGLGLAITRSIIESHCGRIGAAANSERGATFTFTLPGRLDVTV